MHFYSYGLFKLKITFLLQCVIMKYMLILQCNGYRIIKPPPLVPHIMSAASYSINTHWQVMWITLIILFCWKRKTFGPAIRGDATWYTTPIQPLWWTEHTLSWPWHVRAVLVLQAEPARYWAGGFNVVADWYTRKYTSDKMIIPFKKHIDKPTMNSSF